MVASYDSAWIGDNAWAKLDKVQDVSRGKGKVAHLSLGNFLTDAAGIGIDERAFSRYLYGVGYGARMKNQIDSEGLIHHKLSRRRDGFCETLNLGGDDIYTGNQIDCRVVSVRLRSNCGDDSRSRILDLNRGVVDHRAALVVNNSHDRSKGILRLADTEADRKTHDEQQGLRIIFITTSESGETEGTDSPPKLR